MFNYLQIHQSQNDQLPDQHGIKMFTSKISRGFFIMYGAKPQQEQRALFNLKQESSVLTPDKQLQEEHVRICSPIVIRTLSDSVTQ